MLSSLTKGDFFKIAEAKTISRIYKSANGTPEQNIEKVIELSHGGIKNLIGLDDIVIIKVNGQQWNQGGNNLASIRRLVEMILNRPGGFKGEIIIADSNASSNPDSGAWYPSGKFTDGNHGWLINHDPKNNIKNLNDLISYFSSYPVSKKHWRPYHLGGREGIDGFRRDTSIIYKGVNKAGRNTCMTWPNFKSEYSNEIIDLKEGVKGKALKFISCSGLCFHGRYAGVTAAIKVFLGITELNSCEKGIHLSYGKINKSPVFYNFHSCPFWGWGESGSDPRDLGGEIATWINTVRKPDLHITTAEYVGWGHREDTNKCSQTKMVLASKDPLALDYWSSKHVLKPAAKKSMHLLSFYCVRHTDPDNEGYPLHKYLKQFKKVSEANGTSVTMDEKSISLASFDFDKQSLHKDLSS